MYLSTLGEVGGKLNPTQRAAQGQSLVPSFASWVYFSPMGEFLFQLFVL